MNATQLLFSLLADSGTATSSSSAMPNPAKSPIDAGVFKQTFTRALDMQQRKSSNCGPIAAARPDYEPAAAASPRDQAPRAEAPEAPQSPRPRTAAERPSKPEAPEAKTEPAAQNAQAAAAQQASQPAQQQPVSDDDAAAAAEIEIEEPMTDTEKFVEQLLMDLLALLISGRNNGEEIQALAEKLGIDAVQGVDGLTLTFFVDKDSELYKMLAALLTQDSEMDPKLLEQLKLMIQVGDGKALEIPISDLMAQAQTGAKGEGENTLSLTYAAEGSADGEQIALTLKLTPEAVQNAQLVDLSSTNAAPGDVSLMVPADMLSKDELTALLNADKPAGEQVQKALIAAQADAAPKTAAPQALLVPLTAPMDSAKPEVLTADPMLVNTADFFLKKLDMEALARELTQAKRPIEDLAMRFELLMGDRSKSDSMGVLLLNGKDGGFDFLGDFMNRFSQHDTALKAQMQPEAFAEQVKSEMNQPQIEVKAQIPLEFATDRIPFSVRSNDSQVVTQSTVTDTAQARAPHNPANMYEAVLNQVVERINLVQLGPNGGEMRVFLRPEHLGDLQLKVRVDQDVVVAKFVAQSTEVKAIIEANLGQLRDALTQAGINVGRFEVTVAGGNAQQQNAQDGAGSTAPGTEPEIPAQEDIVAGNEHLALIDDIIYGTKPMSVSAMRCNYLA